MMNAPKIAFRSGGVARRHTTSSFDATSANPWILQFSRPFFVETCQNLSNLLDPARQSGDFFWRPLLPSRAGLGVSSHSRNRFIPSAWEAKCLPSRSATRSKMVGRLWPWLQVFSPTNHTSSDCCLTGHSLKTGRRNVKFDLHGIAYCPGGRMLRIDI